MTREVPVTQARADLAELVNRVGYTGERVLLTRHGKPLAALVPVEDLEALERRPAEIGFTLSLPAEAEPEPEQPPRPSGPLRIAAERREAGRSGRPRWKR
ncbi:type II toxin-antitoxin system Phd/YefM family antitoxin [Actinoallomurus rhizosphaericola]|uniref:type II toxin-antitoxin system Phd/YefM family antitoxin n=1 Tax=Actinoallomurus rhizosphaericola TaxID=2952536 RepID=UPI0020900371|nr:type II toxin-antitoxin system Phd/YefM family antitoxin [Actinoallomurus rhizosphaericola]MCO5993391.1 type II toxin-antitoxin system Phd/YefM family antitoxin [Actinoallomurus rhizosphaericola]